MPAPTFNIGRDATLDIVDPQDGYLRFKLLTGIEAQPQYQEVKSRPLNGPPLHDYLEDGWTLTFEFDRADPRIDDYFARREQRFFDGQVRPNVTITQTIKEIDGSVSQYRYTGVALKLDKSGSFKGDSVVGQTISAMASRRIKVA